MTGSLADLDWPVVTDRLTIRLATHDDAAATFAYRSRPEVAQWMTSLPTDLAAYTERFMERAEHTLVVTRDGAVIGDLMLEVQDPWAQTEVADDAKGTAAELGWCLDRAAQGHGYATEAVCALLSIAFEGIGVRRVVALCFADNTASWKLMERIGMRREAHNVADSLHRDGRWLDGMQYALLADEWRAERG